MKSHAKRMHRCHKTNRIARHMSLLPADTLMAEAFRSPFKTGFFEGFREPGLEVAETNDRVVVKAEVPGMMAEKDMKVRYEHGMLAISGEHSVKREMKNKTPIISKKNAGPSNAASGCPGASRQRPARRITKTAL